MSLKAKSFLQSDQFQAFLVIAGFTLILFVFIGRPRLMQDDWTLIIADGVFGRAKWFDWFHQRPLNNTFYNLLSVTFGTNIGAYYWINFGLVLGIYTLVYKLVDHTLSNFKPLGLIAALLALMYPANYTSTWLTMINNHLAWILALTGMWLLLEYVLRRNYWYLAAGSFLVFVPLWIYEGALGISFAWCLLLFFIKKGPPLRNRLGLLIPIGLLASFALLRGIIRPMLGIRGVNSRGFSGATFGLLWERLFEAKILLKAWLGPLPNLLDSLGNHSPSIWLTAGLVLGVILMVVIFSLVFQSRIQKDEVPLEKNEAIKRLFWTALIASGLVVAAMVPTIFVRPLNLDDATTRSNLYAIPPAAVIIACLLSMLALLLAKTRRQYRWLVWVGSIPLLVSAMGIQFFVQQQWQDAWEEQKAIWNSLFQIVPDFESDTTVVLVMQGYQPSKVGVQGFGSHPPIYAEWEFDDALKVLYNNQSLDGRISFPRADYYSETSFSESAVEGPYRSESSPYDETVFLIYRQSTGTIEILEKPERVLGLPFKFPNYAPTERILSEQPPAWLHRELVGANTGETCP